MFVFPSLPEVPSTDLENQPSSSKWNDVKESILVCNFPLHHACRDGDVGKLVKLLTLVSDASKCSVGSVPSLSAEDPFYGWMPAHWAAYFGKLDCLQLIVQATRYVDVPSVKLLQTPTHITAFAGHSFCLKWLLDHGGDPSRWDYMKETPLHKAARTGSIDCISLLISRGAKLHWTNINGKTAAQVAEECGNLQAAQYLCLQSQFNQNGPAKQSGCEIQLNTTISSSGYYGYHPSGVNQVEDVLLTANTECIGGRKRSRETACDSQMNGKRRRTEEFCNGYPDDTDMLSDVVAPIKTHDLSMSTTKCLMAYYI